jgi:transposase-like protein
VALAAWRGDKTVSALAALHGVHPTLIHAWKKQLVSNAEELFQNGARTATGQGARGHPELISGGQGKGPGAIQN